MNIENDHPLGAIAFAEARGQVPQEIPTMEEIVLKKFEVVNEVLAKHPVKAEKAPVVVEEKGSQRWAQGWPGGCTI